MNRTKYIVGKFKKSRIIGCLIFHEVINHSDMAINFNSILGAGFCSIENGQDKPDLKVYGESLSLGIKSREEDKDIIKKALGLYHYLI